MAYNYPNKEMFSIAIGEFPGDMGTNLLIEEEFLNLLINSATALDIRNPMKQECICANIPRKLHQRVRLPPEQKPPAKVTFNNLFYT